ncbi:MAG: hypothetical protein P4M05_28265 [Bradyrhizobium sp.]|nr:hypothetical protein [Bradyrhizobium sp.]
MTSHNAGEAPSPKIVTSCWYSALPGIGTKGATDTHKKLGISRGVPRSGVGAGFQLFKILQPGPWFNSVGPDEYRDRYFDEVLAPLDPAEIVRRIEQLAGGKTAVLVCYEKPHDDEFCHRAYVSAWLKDKLGIDVPELGREADGVGWAHPKLPKQHRVLVPA